MKEDGGGLDGVKGNGSMVLLWKGCIASGHYSEPLQLLWLRVVRFWWEGICYRIGFWTLVDKKTRQTGSQV